MKLITKAVSYNLLRNEARNLCEVDAISIVLRNNHNYIYLQTQSQLPAILTNFA